jgi:hypothetical protein
MSKEAQEVWSEKLRMARDRYENAVCESAWNSGIDSPTVLVRKARHELRTRLYELARESAADEFLTHEWHTGFAQECYRLVGAVTEPRAIAVGDLVRLSSTMVVTHVEPMTSEDDMTSHAIGEG